MGSLSGGMLPASMRFATMLHAITSLLDSLPAGGYPKKVKPYFDAFKRVSAVGSIKIRLYFFNEAGSPSLMYHFIGTGRAGKSFWFSFEYKPHT